uniref:Uncharacterized protein n=1 Tax=Cacopsylla melanoneura TaxID=428564 RepID=A0A8D8TPF9_9HEMI
MYKEWTGKIEISQRTHQHSLCLKLSQHSLPQAESAQCVPETESVQSVPQAVQHSVFLRLSQYSSLCLKLNFDSHLPRKGNSVSPCLFTFLILFVCLNLLRIAFLTCLR